MAKRKRKPKSLTFELGEDGVYRTVKVPGNLSALGPAGGEGVFDASAGVYRNLGIDTVKAGTEDRRLRNFGKALGLRSSKPIHYLPPVPGSFGHWKGAGTAKDPLHYVGVGEKALGYTILALLGVWGLEVLSVDVSNWWQNSSLNIGNDLTKYGAEFLAALGYPVATDSTGKVTAVGTRQHATFFTWLFNQVMVQGADLGQATLAVSGLAVGLSPGPPTGSPAAQAGLQVGGGPVTYGNPAAYNPSTGNLADTTSSTTGGNCQLGYSLMSLTVNGVTMYLCVRVDWINYQLAAGWVVVNGTTGLTSTPPTGSSGSSGSAGSIGHGPPHHGKSP